MPDNITQIELILLLIAPGYMSYSLKEMWVSYREKSQFEKLLNSLVYTLIIWSPFWIFLDNPNIENLSLIHWLILICLIFILAWIMAKVEQKKYLFLLGDKLRVSIKKGQNIPLFEGIFNSPDKLSSA